MRGYLKLQVGEYVLLIPHTFEIQDSRPVVDHFVAGWGDAYVCFFGHRKVGESDRSDFKLGFSPHGLPLVSLPFAPQLVALGNTKNEDGDVGIRILREIFEEDEALPETSLDGPAYFFEPPSVTLNLPTQTIGSPKGNVQTIGAATGSYSMLDLVILIRRIFEGVADTTASSASIVVTFTGNTGDYELNGEAISAGGYYAMSTAEVDTLTCVAADPDAVGFTSIGISNSIVIPKTSGDLEIVLGVPRVSVEFSVSGGVALSDFELRDTTGSWYVRPAGEDFFTEVTYPYEVAVDDEIASDNSEVSFRCLDDLTWTFGLSNGAVISGTTVTLDMGTGSPPRTISLEPAGG